MRKKISLVCLAAVFSALLVSILFYINHTSPSPSDSAMEQIEQFDMPRYLPQVSDGHVNLAVSGRIYEFSLSSSDSALQCAPPEPIQDPAIRALRVRTAFRFPVTKNGDPVGSVLLTFDQSKEGTVFYLESDRISSSGVLQMHIQTIQDDGLSVRSIAFGNPSIPKTQAPLWDEPYSAHSSLYLSGDGVHLRLSRLSSLQDLGQTVYAYRHAAAGATLSCVSGKLLISLPLDCSENGSFQTSGVLTSDEGVNWEDEEAVNNVQNLDASSIDYHLHSNGVYVAMPEDYSPRKKGESHIYRTASAWLLGPCTYESNGTLFGTVGKSILYNYLDHVNQDGFLPTEPTSGWLQSDFGIGGGFYDTRFNFDTMKRLMRAEAVWDDHAIGETVNRMLEFYCTFADQNQFDFLGYPFVPDYGNADGSASNALSSLNHYLSEGVLLLRAGDTYGDPNYSKRGWKILDSINATYYRWIRDNADLWYAVYPDGWLRRNDYVEVTYNDLTDAAALLSKYGRWEEYTGIQALLHEKERWLLLAGRPELLKEHAAFTFVE